MNFLPYAVPCAIEPEILDDYIVKTMVDPILVDPILERTNDIEFEAADSEILANQANELIEVFSDSSDLPTTPPIETTSTDPVLISPPPGGITSSSSEDLNLRLPRHRKTQDAQLTGDQDLNLAGNKLSNRLTGNSGNNRIEGRRGEDYCIGGGGADHFVLIAKTGSQDWLTDFNPLDDKLMLKGKRLQRLFSGGELREGVLGEFLIWEQSSQSLLFDRDGSMGDAKPICMAIIPDLQGENLLPSHFLNWAPLA
jgi:Ca2+-binding RTX toxin-like protein